MREVPKKEAKNRPDGRKVSTMELNIGKGKNKTDKPKPSTREITLGSGLAEKARKIKKGYPSKLEKRMAELGI